MTTLHVRPGDDIRDSLPAAGFVGEFLCYADPVCEGPVPLGVDLVEVRTRYLADPPEHPLADVRARLRAAESAVQGIGAHDRVVLWFEHDWLCQAVLVRVLATAPPHPDLRLVSTDRMPGVDPFHGFGQLGPDELATLAGRDVPVTAEAIALARRAWTALRDPSPRALQSLVDDADPALPYLTGAVRRHLQELPWRSDGLALSERLCLRAVAEAPGRLHDLFPRVQARDPAPFQGDTQIRRTLERLADADSPALAVEDGRWTLTPDGRRLLDGERRWHTRPRWLGGVHLTSPDWVWEDTAARAGPA